MGQGMGAPLTLRVVRQACRQARALARDTQVAAVAQRRVVATAIPGLGFALV